MDLLRFDAQVWLHHGGSWHFVTVPQDVSDLIEAHSGGRDGFGSVRVRVTIGTTTWATSLFPDTKQAAYVLPLKKEVRRQENLEAGSRVWVDLLLEDP